MSAEGANNKDIQRFNLGLIGAGDIGKIYLRTILSNKKVRLVYIIDDDVEGVKKLLQEENDLQYTMALPLEEADLLFEDKSIDGCVVTCTTKSYKTWVLQALKSGLSVLCDAPLCMNLKDMMRCYEISKKTNQQLFCGFNQRFHSQYIEARDEIRSGHLGTISMVKISFKTPRVQFESLLHHIDLICWMLESYPNKVVGTLSSVDGENEVVVMTMKFGDRTTIGLIEASHQNGPADEQLIEVCGTSESISISNGSSSTLTYHRNNGSTFQPINSKCQQSPFSNSYVEVINHFADIIAGVTNVSVSSESSISVAKIIEAFKISVEDEKFVAVELQGKLI